MVEKDTLKTQKTRHKVYTISTILSAGVSDPDPVGSGFKLPCWIRILIRNPDPESEIEL